MKTLGELAKELLHSAATASNDDVSAPMTEERRRHSARLEAMRDAADRLEAIEKAWRDFDGAATSAKWTRRRALERIITGKEP